jgi:hypothetical protein
MLFAAMTTVARPMPQPVEAGLRADVSVACDTVRASWRVDLDVQAAPTAKRSRSSRNRADGQSWRNSSKSNPGAALTGWSWKRQSRRRSAQAVGSS